jgi:hypothetical protein
MLNCGIVPCSVIGPIIYSVIITKVLFRKPINSSKRDLFKKIKATN